MEKSSLAAKYPVDYREIKDVASSVSDELVMQNSVDKVISATINLPKSVLFILPDFFHPAGDSSLVEFIYRLSFSGSGRISRRCHVFMMPADMLYKIVRVKQLGIGKCA
jgi:hypothetical protein